MNPQRGRAEDFRLCFPPPTRRRVRSLDIHQVYRIENKLRPGAQFLFLKSSRSRHCPSKEDTEPALPVPSDLTYLGDMPLIDQLALGLRLHLPKPVELRRTRVCVRTQKIPFSSRQVMVIPFRDKLRKNKKKTCNSWDSLVVTHPTTNQPACGLSTAERTGSPVFHTLWSHVLDFPKNLIQMSLF